MGKKWIDKTIKINLYRNSGFKVSKDKYVLSTLEKLINRMPKICKTVIKAKKKFFIRKIASFPSNISICNIFVIL